MFNTLYDQCIDGSDFVCGYPHSLRAGVPTGVSHGLWMNQPDYDALRVFWCRRIVAKQKRIANSCTSTDDLQLLLLLAEVMKNERSRSFDLQMVC